MRNAPIVSVVMAAYNAASTIVQTTKSIQSQSFEKWELILIDDGSTDETFSLVETLSKNDRRVQVIKSVHSGLTHSLNIGCASAKGEFIARADSGDVSLPQRLEQQRKYLHAFPEVVAVGCGARRVTSSMEFLGTRSRREKPYEITRQLTEEGVGILHPGSMFRRDAYEKVGGYRTQFRYAQDFDLWLRLSEIGLIAECPEVLLELTIDDHGISATRIDQQRVLAKLAFECYKARQLGRSEAEWLAEAEKVSQSVPAKLSAQQQRRQQRRAQYFIGGQLLEQNNPACRKYFLRSLLDRRLFLASLAKLGQSVFCKTSSLK